MNTQEQNTTVADENSQAIVEATVQAAVTDFFDKLNGPAPETYAGEEPQNTESELNPLMVAVDHSLSVLEDISIYAGCNRTATCETLAKEAIATITKLKERFIEQEQIIDILQK